MKMFRRMTAAVIFGLCLCPVSLHAQKADDTYEARAIHAFLLYCLPALTASDSVARVAEMQKLPELNAEAEKAFLHGQPGKVFGLPEVGGGIVLSAPQSPMCSVLIQKMDQAEFIKQIDLWFDPQHSPFTNTENQTAANGEIERKYTANMHGAHILLLVSARKEPIDGGVQAMITAGRTQN